MYKYMEKCASLKVIASAAERARELPVNRRLWVLCHGVFDIFHFGHLVHLQQAKACGDVLVVAILADRFVRKGPGRPYFRQLERAQVLAALTIVNYVTIIRSSVAMPALKALRPDVYCKGPDYQDPRNPFIEAFNRERGFVESYGGRVVLTEGRVAGSSALLEKSNGRL